MYYGMIKKSDVADGPGVRVSLFVSGCRHHCEGCFNAETWDFKYGDVYTAEIEEEILRAMEHSYISGFTFLGGEPMEPENRPFVCFCLIFSSFPLYFYTLFFHLNIVFRKKNKYNIKRIKSNKNHRNFY